MSTQLEPTEYHEYGSGRQLSHRSSIMSFDCDMDAKSTTPITPVMKKVASSIDYEIDDPVSGSTTNISAKVKAKVPILSAQAINFSTKQTSLPMDSRKHDMSLRHWKVGMERMIWRVEWMWCMVVIIGFSQK